MSHMTQPPTRKLCEHWTLFMSGNSQSETVPARRIRSRRSSRRRRLFPSDNNKETRAVFAVSLNNYTLKTDIGWGTSTLSSYICSALMQYTFLIASFFLHVSELKCSQINIVFANKSIHDSYILVHVSVDMCFSVHESVVEVYSFAVYHAWAARVAFCQLNPRHNAAVTHNPVPR